MSDNNEKPNKSRTVTPASDITDAFDPKTGSGVEEKNAQGVIEEMKKERGGSIFSKPVSIATEKLSITLVDEIVKAIVRNIFGMVPPASVSGLAESEDAIKARCRAFARRDEYIIIQSENFWVSVDIALDYPFLDDELEKVTAITDDYDLWPVIEFLDLLKHTPYGEKLFQIIIDAMRETDTFNA